MFARARRRKAMPSGRFPGGGAVRLSGLQNPKPHGPVTGGIPGWRLTPYPGYKTVRATSSPPPSGR
ncbi:hypothetical protein KOSB73_70180 [Klebsiella grimontii]|uniref:Uncharacterized protein n=1 Tax=Klebsiella grimontii TaxID=2058152 RepID=A0A285BBS7_9ENTR|nr:hypothetical protein KOSB73_70180 [Klebsiella grimontii]